MERKGLPMKKMRLMLLLLATCALLATPIMADEITYYGDFAYKLVGGEAIIVDSNYNTCAPTWEETEAYRFVRYGLDDESALYPKAADANGVRRLVVPATLDGHPVVAIADDGLATSTFSDIVLPGSITRIGKSAFYGCKRADAITIPDSVTFIGEGAFYECPAMLRVTEGSYAAQYAMENDLPYTYDLDYAVYQSGDFRYTLLNGKATICQMEVHQFNKRVRDTQNDDTPLDLVIPDQLNGHPVTGIQGLSEPSSKVDVSAYYPKSERVIIPASVTEIIGNPFGAGSSSLTEFIVSPYNPVFETIDGVLFNKAKKELISYPGAREGDYAIPEGTVVIGEEAFRHANLGDVTIPASVTTIVGNPFGRCYELSGIIVSPDNPVISYADDVLLDMQNGALVRSETAGHYDIPEGIKTIADYAFFENTDLTGITMPDSAITIGDFAFYGCSNLADMTLPRNLESIGDDAFSDCFSITNVTLPASMKRIGNCTFSYCKALTSVSIAEGITHIDAYAFEWCYGLESITIPSSVISIHKYAFERHEDHPLTLIVTEGSYAEQYAIDNEIAYTYTPKT